MCTIWKSLPIHLPVGEITLKPLQEFRDANKTFKLPLWLGLWIEVNTLSISEKLKSVEQSILKSFLEGGKAGGCLEGHLSLGISVWYQFRMLHPVSLWPIKILTDTPTTWGTNNITFNTHTFRSTSEGDTVCRNLSSRNDAPGSKIGSLEGTQSLGGSRKTASLIYITHGKH